MPDYDSRLIAAHFDSNTDSIPVLLINEAPGPQEAKAGIPLVGQQGGNLYRALVAAGINWAKEWAARHPDFKWPVKAREDYSAENAGIDRMFALRQEFLQLRARYVACTNSFPRWPKPACRPGGFVAPAEEDILADQNVARLKREIARIKPSTLLVCGRCAYLACTGMKVGSPSGYEGRVFDLKTADLIRVRLEHDFEEVWYLGHTRRWSTKGNLIPTVLAGIGRRLGWV